jgi:hypothetical protein
MIEFSGCRTNQEFGYETTETQLLHFFRDYKKLFFHQLKTCQSYHEHERSFPNMQHSDSCAHGLPQGRKLLSAVQDIRKVVCDVRYIHTLEMQSKSTWLNNVAACKACRPSMNSLQAPRLISCIIILNYENL